MKMDPSRKRRKLLQTRLLVARIKMVIMMTTMAILRRKEKLMEIVIKSIFPKMMVLQATLGKEVKR